MRGYGGVAVLTASSLKLADRVRDVDVTELQRRGRFRPFFESLIGALARNAEFIGTRSRQRGDMACPHGHNGHEADTRRAVIKALTPALHATPPPHTGEGSHGETVAVLAGGEES